MPDEIVALCHYDDTLSILTGHVRRTPQSFADIQATHDSRHGHRLAVLGPEQEATFTGTPFEFRARRKAITRDGFG